MPWNDEFDWNAVNYAPLTVGGLILAVGIWWLVSARHIVHRPGPQRSSSARALGVVSDEPTRSTAPA